MAAQLRPANTGFRSLLPWTLSAARVQRPEWESEATIKPTKSQISPKEPTYGAHFRDRDQGMRVNPASGWSTGETQTVGSSEPSALVMNPRTAMPRELQVNHPRVTLAVCSIKFILLLYR